MSPLLDTLYARAERRLQPDSWLVHTYTRERRVPGERDPYGEQGGWTYAEPEPGIPCYWKQDGIQGLDTSGNPVLVSQVTLTVKADDPIKRGDRISQVMDRKQVVVDAGPEYVRWTQNVTSFGPTQFIKAYMQEAEGIG
jgi:hypothetical protein